MSDSDDDKPLAKRAPFVKKEAAANPGDGNFSILDILLLRYCAQSQDSGHVPSAFWLQDAMLCILLPGKMDKQGIAAISRALPASLMGDDTHLLHAQSLRLNILSRRRVLLQR